MAYSFPIETGKRRRMLQRRESIAEAGILANEIHRPQFREHPLHSGIEPYQQYSSLFREGALDHLFDRK